MVSPAAPHVRLLSAPEGEASPRAPETTVPEAALSAEPLDVVYTHTRVRPEAYAQLQCTAGLVRGGASPLDESFRLLRHRVLQALPAGRGALVAITAPGISGRAASAMTALNLALAIAADLNHTALLLDAELAGDGVQQRFGFTPAHPAPGLAEHLADGVPLPELLLNPGLERFVLLPAGARTAANAAELLASRAASALAAELRLRYPDRITLVSLPPLLGSAEALAFLPHVDASLLVVERHRTGLHELERCAELLVPYRTLGTVLAPAPCAPAGQRWWQRLLAPWPG